MRYIRSVGRTDRHRATAKTALNVGRAVKKTEMDPRMVTFLSRCSERSSVNDQKANWACAACVERDLSTKVPNKHYTYVECAILTAAVSVTNATVAVSAVDTAVTLSAVGGVVVLHGITSVQDQRRRPPSLWHGEMLRQLHARRDAAPHVWSVLVSEPITESGQASRFRPMTLYFHTSYWHCQYVVQLSPRSLRQQKGTTRLPFTLKSFEHLIYICRSYRKSGLLFIYWVYVCILYIKFFVCRKCLIIFSWKLSAEKTEAKFGRSLLKYFFFSTAVLSTNHS